MHNSFDITIHTKLDELAGWSANVEIMYTIGSDMKCKAWCVSEIHWIRNGIDELPPAILQANEAFYKSMITVYLRWRRNMAAICEDDFQTQTLNAVA
jgi:hypothetical protein